MQKLATDPYWAGGFFYPALYLYMYLHLLAVGVEMDLGVLSATGANNLPTAVEKAQEFIAFGTSYLGHNTPPFKKLFFKVYGIHIHMPMIVQCVVSYADCQSIGAVSHRIKLHIRFLIGNRIFLYG